ncbi:MAG: TrmH family RNA methyltransferase [Chitinophagaceae bacterium]|nr:MAG: TrmH family RNA methyltransferase [Chitinophagaceae bacterium]
MEELNRTEASEQTDDSRFPVHLVLDDVRSMHNVGSAFRTADAFNAKGIYLCGYTPRPPHRDIHKTALGATETVPWSYEEDIVKALNQLRNDGYALWAVEQVHNSISLADAPFTADQKIALVFGNEVTGVSDAALALCDGCIEIPQWGTKHSLNISVTVGIVLWEIVKKNKTVQQ